MSRSTTIITYGVLGVAALSTFLLPFDLAPSRVQASAPDTIRLYGVVRDFRSTHADFDVVPSGGYGHYAGNAGLLLGSGGTPVYVGDDDSPAPDGSAAPMRTGTYLGNGFDDRSIVGLGFQPDVLIIKADARGSDIWTLPDVVSREEFQRLVSGLASPRNPLSIEPSLAAQ